MYTFINLMMVVTLLLLFLPPASLEVTLPLDLSGHTQALHRSPRSAGVDEEGHELHQRLAVGFADGLPEAKLDVFVLSFRQHAPTSQLVLFAYDRPPNVARYGPRVHVVQGPRANGQHLSNHRFALYRQYVEQLPVRPRVLLNTDASAAHLGPLPTPHRIAQPIDTVTPAAATGVGCGLPGRSICRGGSGCGAHRAGRGRAARRRLARGVLQQQVDGQRASLSSGCYRGGAARSTGRVQRLQCGICRCCAILNTPGRDCDRKVVLYPRLRTHPLCQLEEAT